MEHADVQRWLDDYVAAWKSYDREAIGALFAEDCEYRYRPYGDTGPRPGRASSPARDGDPSDDPGQARDLRRVVRPFAVEGDVAVAVGIEHLHRPATVYDNCYLLRFDADGRCSEFTEWFMKRPTE